MVRHEVNTATKRANVQRIRAATRAWSPVPHFPVAAPDLFQGNGRRGVADGSETEARAARLIVADLSTIGHTSDHLARCLSKPTSVLRPFVALPMERAHRHSTELSYSQAEFVTPSLCWKFSLLEAVGNNLSAKGRCKSHSGVARLLPLASEPRKNCVKNLCWIDAL